MQRAAITVLMANLCGNAHKRNNRSRREDGRVVVGPATIADRKMLFDMFIVEARSAVVYKIARRLHDGLFRNVKREGKLRIFISKALPEFFSCLFLFLIFNAVIYKK